MLFEDSSISTVHTSVPFHIAIDRRNVSRAGEAGKLYTHGGAHRRTVHRDVVPNGMMRAMHVILPPSTVVGKRRKRARCQEDGWRAASCMPCM
jgi:hypothetical protein